MMKYLILLYLKIQIFPVYNEFLASRHIEKHVVGGLVQGKSCLFFDFWQISNGDQASNNKAGTKKLLETNFLGNQSLRQRVQLLTTQLDFVHLATVEIHLVVEHLILLLELLVVVAHLHDKAANFDLLVQWQSQLDVKE